MKKRLFWVGLVLIPLSILVLVNASSPRPTHQFQVDRCTRACHDKGCQHFEARKTQKPLVKSLEGLYVANIHWLRHNPLGLSYQQMNLFVYVLMMPIFILFFTWTLMRKKNG